MDGQGSVDRVRLEPGVRFRLWPSERGDANGAIEVVDALVAPPLIARLDEQRPVELLAAFYAVTPGGLLACERPPKGPHLFQADGHCLLARTAEEPVLLQGGESFAVGEQRLFVQEADALPWTADAVTARAVRPWTVRFRFEDLVEVHGHERDSADPVTLRGNQARFVQHLWRQRQRGADRVPCEEIAALFQDDWPPVCRNVAWRAAKALSQRWPERALYHVDRTQKTVRLLTHPGDDWPP